MKIIAEWFEAHVSMVYVEVLENWHERGPNDTWWIWDVNYADWCISFDMMLCAFCAYISCSLIVSLGVHIFCCVGSSDYCPWNVFFKSVNFFKGCCNWPIPKSYNKPCVLITFPGFWVWSNDLVCLGTAFNDACCFCGLSICVGSHFIHRSWFLQGLLIGCLALLSHL